MAKRDRNMQSLAQTFRILGDQTRLHIVQSLQEGELNVSDICKKLKVPQPTVSHHLGILRMGGLVSNRRSGKEIFYSLNGTDGESEKVLRSMLKDSSAIRIGPVVIGLS